MKKTIKILGILVIVGILAAMYIYKFVYNKQQPDFENLKANYTLNAASLYNEFKSNTAVSSTKYNGKMLEITGTLASVEKGDSLHVAVFVFNQGDFGDEGIRCTLLKDADATLLKLKQTITLKGYCTGFNDTDVILDKCSTIK